MLKLKIYSIYSDKRLYIVNNRYSVIWNIAPPLSDYHRVEDEDWFKIGTCLLENF